MGSELLCGESGIRVENLIHHFDGYRQKDDQSINSKTLLELLEEEEICIVRTVA